MKKTKSRSEVGNNKNAANFIALTQILEEMGTMYNPANTNIAMSSLTPFQENLTIAISNFNLKKPVYTNAVVDRETVIAGMGKKSSRILNSFMSLSIPKGDKENAASIVRKIRGDKRPAKVDPNKADAITISTSQMSYDSRIANFEVLIGFISSHPQYAPNEADITISALQDYYQELKALTQAVNAAGNAVITAKQERNDILYNGPINVIELSREIKAYLKSIGEPAKPFYKAAVRLKFRDL